MALTIVEHPGPASQVKDAGLVIGVKRVTFDSTYPAGGEAIADSDFGVNSVIFVAPAVTTNGYVVQYDYAAKKLKVWYGDNNNAADGPLVENATVDLSAESCFLFYIGR